MALAFSHKHAGDVTTFRLVGGAPAYIAFIFLICLYFAKAALELDSARNFTASKSNPASIYLSFAFYFTF